MNRKLFLAATCVLLFLGACTVASTAPQPDLHPVRDEEPDTTATNHDGGGSMGNGN
jgi:hypothetical protein